MNSIQVRRTKSLIQTLSLNVNSLQCYDNVKFNKMKIEKKICPINYCTFPFPSSFLTHTNRWYTNLSFSNPVNVYLHQTTSQCNISFPLYPISSVNGYSEFIDNKKANKIWEFIQIPVYEMDSAQDFLDNLHEELREHVGNCFLSTNSRSPSVSSRLTQQHLVSMKASDVIRDNYVLWIEGIDQKWTRSFVFDTTHLQQQHKQLSEDYQKISLERDHFDKVLTGINKKASINTRVVEYASLTYLVSQLSTVVVLTYELGWDLMEPVSYLLTLGTSIMMFSFSCFKRKEYSYPNTYNWLRESFFKRLCKTKNYNPYEHHLIEKKLDFTNDFIKKIEKYVP